jgi:hypothetical protein
LEEGFYSLEVGYILKEFTVMSWKRKWFLFLKGRIDTQKKEVKKQRREAFLFLKGRIDTRKKLFSLFIITCFYSLKVGYIQTVISCSDFFSSYLSFYSLKVGYIQKEVSRRRQDSIKRFYSLKVGYTRLEN